MMDYFFEGVWRMDWGLGNPNKTGALIALLMLSVWTFAGFQRWGFWVVLVLFMGLGICLIHTFSRGAILSLFVGMGILLWKSSKPWSRNRIVAGVLAVWLMLGCAIWLQATKRVGQSFAGEDRSISNRIQIWKSAPQMIGDAPAGWGFGKAGEAYMHWYQPVDKSETYRTLVNSHLTWMVEGGWLFTLGYLALWAAVIVICMPSVSSQSAVALAVWICFALSAWFSSVAEDWILWIIPGLALAVKLIDRFRKAEWPQPKVGAMSGVAVFVGCMVLVGLGWAGGGEVQRKAGRVLVGEHPKVWVVFDEKVLGTRFGQQLRMAVNQGDVTGVGVVDRIGNLGRLGSDDSVFVAGRPKGNDLEQIDLLLKAGVRVVFLNPDFHPAELGFVDSNTPATEVWFGEFTESGYKAAWHERARVRDLAGMSDYMADISPFFTKGVIP